jgi:spore coat polysaccharide biosynthesis protein SpsF
MKKKYLIVAIIQARMSSSRLWGKVLRPICGKPMLWHVIERLKKCRNIDKIAVATTQNAIDNRIEKFCRLNGISCFRGSENDVLSRYYEAAKFFRAKVIIRITSDCPLIDPTIVDRTVSAYLVNKNYLAGSSNVLKRTFPRGLDTEVFSFEALAKAHLKSKKQYQREHITQYFYENPAKFHFASVEQKKDFSHLRWTVDDPRDLRMIRKIFLRLYRNNKPFTTAEVLALLVKEPSIACINSEVRQKAIK